MKALTVREPYASAIVHGPKRIENRTWRPPPHSHGQRIVIHSAKTFGKLERKAVMDLWRSKTFDWVGIAQDRCDDALGCLLGVATIIGTLEQHPSDLLHWKWYVEDEDRRQAFIDVAGSQLVTWFDKRSVGWLLDDVQPLVEPVFVKGALGLWEVPDEVTWEVAA